MRTVKHLRDLDHLSIVDVHCRACGRRLGPFELVNNTESECAFLPSRARGARSTNIASHNGTWEVAVQQWRCGCLPAGTLIARRLSRLGALEVEQPPAGPPRVYV